MAAMQLDVTFRNIESSEALKAYAREKVERVNKYVDRPMEAHVVLSSERHVMHADIQIHVAQSDLVLRGKAKEEDLYASVDVAMDKIERQLRRYKEKLKSYDLAVAEGTATSRSPLAALHRARLAEFLPLLVREFDHGFLRFHPTKGGNGEEDKPCLLLPFARPHKRSITLTA